jgi:hypothetical protein
MYSIEKIPHVLDDLVSAVRSLCMLAHDDRDDTRRWAALHREPIGEQACEMPRVDQNRAEARQR